MTLFNFFQASQVSAPVVWMETLSSGVLSAVGKWLCSMLWVGP